MANKKSFLYNLCERTHTSRVLEKTIEDINAHLQKIAWRGRSTANIAIHDTKEYKDTVYFSPVFPSTIIVNIANIKLSLNTIREFIVVYYEEQEIEVDFNTSGEYMEFSLSWENKIQEYLDSQTKADDPEEAYNGCIDVNKVLDDIELFITKCIGEGNSEYINLSVTFCDLNSEDAIIDNTPDTITYIIKLPDTNNGHAFFSDIYQYFTESEKYCILSRPLRNLVESSRYEIKLNDEYEEYIKAQRDASSTSCSNQIDNTKTTDVVTATGVHTDAKRGNIIISNDKNRIEWDKISNCLNYHLNEQSEEYMYIQIQSGSYETLKHPIRIEDNIWRLPIQLLDIDSPEVMAGYVCDFCTELGYDIRLVSTAYNNVGVTGYMIYRVSKKEDKK